MYNLKLNKHKNFVDMVGNVMHTNEIWKFMKVKNDKFLILDEFANYIEPIFDIESKKQLKAMKSKMDFMYTNQVWILVDLF